MPAAGPSLATPAVVDLWLNLIRAVLATADAGRPTPCTADPGPFHADDRPTRLEAATACTWCPLLTECGRYALDAGHRDGVWGGVDLTPWPGSGRRGRDVLAERLCLAGPKAVA